LNQDYISWRIFTLKTLSEVSEIKINAWTRRSQKEGICGILNCFSQRTNRCRKCMNHYYHEHLESHFDIVPDWELEYLDREKKGLDYFT
jgi:hypothetical protein